MKRNMRCNCKETIEARELEEFKNRRPNDMNHVVNLGGYGYIIKDDKVMYCVTLPIEYSSVRKYRDGKIKKVTNRMEIELRYCPFCGEKI